MSDDLDNYQPNVNPFQMYPAPNADPDGGQQPGQPEPQPPLTFEQALDRVPKTINWIDLAKKVMPRIDARALENDADTGGSSTSEEPSYNAFDYLPKPSFPAYRTGEGTYGRPIQFEGQPIESSQPYNVIRSEEKDGTYYHFVDQFPTRKLTPGETDVVAGVAGLPVGAALQAPSGMVSGTVWGTKVGGPLAGEIGGLVGLAGGALYGGAKGYSITRDYLDDNYHHPIQRQGNHVFIENDMSSYP